MDYIKDHLIPNISVLESAKHMYDVLIKLFESKNTSRKTVLKNQLREVTMTKSESTTTTLNKMGLLKGRTSP